MGSKSLPRVVHEGESCIVLHRGKPLREIDLLWGPKRELVIKIAQKYAEYLELAHGWFSVDTGEVLFLFEEEDETVWAVRDSTDNSAKYRALQNKAQRFEKKIIERLNGYTETLKIAYAKPKD